MAVRQLTALTLLLAAAPAFAQRVPQPAIGGVSNFMVPITSVQQGDSVTPGTGGAAVDVAWPAIPLPSPSALAAAGNVRFGITAGGALRGIALGITRATAVGLAFSIGLELYSRYGITPDGAGGLEQGGAPANPTGGCYTMSTFPGSFPVGCRASPSALATEYAQWAGRSSCPGGTPSGVLSYCYTAGGCTFVNATQFYCVISATRTYDGHTQTSNMDGIISTNNNTAGASGAGSCAGGSAPVNGQCPAAPGTGTPTTPEAAADYVTANAGQGGRPPLPSNGELATAVGAATAYGPMTMRPGDIMNPQMNVVPGGYAGPVTTAADIFGNGGTVTTSTQYDYAPGGNISVTVPEGTFANIPYTWTGTHIFAGAGGTTHIGYGSSSITSVPALTGSWNQTTTSTTRNSSGTITGQTTQTGTIEGTATGQGTATGEDACVRDPSRIGCRSIGDPPAAVVPTVNRTLSFTAETVALSSGCPAPYTITVRGWSMSLRWDKACDVAPLIRFFIVGSTLLSCLVWCVSIVNKT